MQYPPGLKLRPLDSWPGELTRERRTSQFASTLTDTVKLLTRELKLFDPKDPNLPVCVMQIALREQDFRVTDGMPRANAKPDHPGVILTVDSANKPSTSFPCDTFLRWEDNLRAIALTLEALRKIDRYGVTKNGQQYRGWQAIEARSAVDATEAACAVVARIAWPNERSDNLMEWSPKIATDGEIGRKTIRKALANAHPDRNDGRRETWNRLELALDGLRRAGVEWAA